MYLDQFKRGWSHTAVYLLRDRTDEGGNQSFGFFKSDYTPRKAAVYLHNLTTILADRGSLDKPGQLNYSIPEQPPTVHEMLLQKSDGTFELVVWGERLEGRRRGDRASGQPVSDGEGLRSDDRHRTRPDRRRSRFAEVDLERSSADHRDIAEMSS